MPAAILEALIGDIDEFKKSYWRQKPYLYRSPDPAAVAGILSLAAVDEILASPATRPPYVELARKSKALRERDFVQVAGSKSLEIVDAVNTNVVAAEFEKGATVILNHPDDYHPPAQEVCRAFQDEFLANTKTVAFITPPGRQALGLHYDTFEGFIVQTHGTKKWYVYEALDPLPVSPLGMEDDAIVGPPVVEVVLRPGDCLYMPWGSPHYAQSQDEVSCHVTVMLVPTTWTKFLAELVSSLVPDEADDDLPFRDPTADVAEISAEAAEWLERTLVRVDQVDFDVALDTLRRDQPFREPERAGFLEEAARGGALKVGSRVSRTRNVSIEFHTVDRDRIELKIGTSTFHLPASARGALEHLVEADAMRVADLPADLPDVAKLKLTQHLLQHGVLTLHSL